MANAVLLGFLWRILKKDKKILVDEIMEFFADKQIDKQIEKKCILAGYENSLYRDTYSNNILLPKTKTLHSKQYTMTGNDFTP